MKSAKDLGPKIIVVVGALLITGIIRYFMPAQNNVSSEKDIAIPHIPLIAKNQKIQVGDVLVLVVNEDIKANEKVKINKFSWKKWPAAANQSYFIAKDPKGVPLNNGADYSNLPKMWAKNDIPRGVPATMSMFTNVDIAKEQAEEKIERQKREAEKREAEKKAALQKEAKKKKQEEIKAQEAMKKANDLGLILKKGMRAVTVPIDQRSANSNNLLEVGDYVDVLIMPQQMGDGRSIFKYKSLRILALDGVTKKKFDNEVGAANMIGSVVNGNVSIPRHVTLQVKEELVDKLLKLSVDRGVILCVRSYQDKESESLEVDDSSDAKQKDKKKKTASNSDEHENINTNSIENVLNKLDIDNKNANAASNKNQDMNLDIARIERQLQKVDTANTNQDANIDAVRIERQLQNVNANHADKNNEKNSSELSNMMLNIINNQSISGSRYGTVDRKSRGSIYEVVSGKIVGGDEQNSETEESVTLFKKLDASKELFDANGDIISESEDEKNKSTSSSSNANKNKSSKK